MKQHCGLVFKDEKYRCSLFGKKALSSYKEWHLLDGMPKGLASLSELQVHQGFVIGNVESKRDDNH
ncbi:hypothetical protein CFP56_003919 [Quercus suber]|uniref:Uncharacterized protein n=1 Tax=Quercus suber TaxID=58331 RepID=A0AAW0LBH8_QUESU